jgi:hypothetical protein
MTNEGHFLAVSAKTGELVMRGSRPIYATRAVWDGLGGGFKVAALIPMTNAVFGALPMDDTRYGPDPIATVLRVIDRMTPADLIAIAAR